MHTSENQDQFTYTEDAQNTDFQASSNTKNLLHMTKSVRSAHAEKNLHANKKIINKEFGFFSPGSIPKDSEDGLGTDPVTVKLDAWGMSTESLSNVRDIETIGAGGKYEKKVIKKDLQLNSGHRASDGTNNNDDIWW